VAEYAPGPARPTGGAGAVVFLIGKTPAIYLEPIRASHMSHAYDFYKPDLGSPFPTVDGQHSNYCFMNAFDRCYQLLNQKYEKQLKRNFSRADFDHFICHSPYNKLVLKTFNRVLFNDFLRDPSNPEFEKLYKFKDLSAEASYSNRELYKTLTSLSSKDYKSKVEPHAELTKEIGNVYSASIFLSLFDLARLGTELSGKRILCYSYGSGLCSSLYVLRGGNSEQSRKLLARLGKQCQFRARLKERLKKCPAEFTQVLDARAKSYGKPGPYTPIGGLEDMLMGAFYYAGMDEKSRRWYRKKCLETCAAL